MLQKIDKERAKSLGVNYARLSTGTLIGTAILYNVKQYKSEADFKKIKINIMPITKIWFVQVWIYRKECS
jgi:hypothetical protein